MITIDLQYFYDELDLIETRRVCTYSKLSEDCTYFSLSYKLNNDHETLSIIGHHLRLSVSENLTN